MAVYQVPANATQWGLLRQVKWGSTIDNKKVGIVFDTTGGIFNAYLRVDDGQTVTDLRILTPADIPSDTGVISVNGQAGVVVLDATDILMETGVDTRTVQTVIAGLELDMSNAFTDIQTVNSNQADGFSTAATYAVGDLVLHNDVLYKCIVAVTTAGAWNSANWQQTTIADELGGGDDNLAYVEDGSTASRNYNAGDYIIWQGTAYQASTAIGSGTTLAVGTNLTAITGGVANALNASLLPLPDYSTTPVQLLNIAGSGTKENLSVTIPHDGYYYLQGFYSEARINVNNKFISVSTYNGQIAMGNIYYLPAGTYTVGYYGFGNSSYFYLSAI